MKPTTDARDFVAFEGLASAPAPLAVRVSFYRRKPKKRFHAVSPCLLSFIHTITQITPIGGTCGFNPVCRTMTRRHSELKSLNNERLAAVSFHAGMSYARY